MVVGQDLGVTLDMEGWLMRAHNKGITMTTDLVVMGAGPDGLDLQFRLWSTPCSPALMISR